MPVSTTQSSLLKKVLGSFFLLAALLVLPQTILAIELEAGDLTLRVSGNVNAHYIYTVCDPSPSPVVEGNALLCQADDNVNAVSNGLLPASLQTSVSTTQAGLDLSVTFGLWLGTVANSGVTDFSGVDVRQVFLTFGNKEIGTVKVGRDFGLFGLDAVLNDISLVGVGPSAAVLSPLNTSLGGIGYGYIYADRLSQIDYTTPDLGGFSATLGVFQPYDLRTLGANSIGGGAPDGSDAVDTGSVLPGFQGRVAINFKGDLGGFVSLTGITQNVKTTVDMIDVDYQAFGGDITVKLDFIGFGLLLYGYYTVGIGITGILFDAVDQMGNERDGYGGMAQLSYKIDSTRIGVNGGISRLDQTSEDPDTNLSQQLRLTGGVYHALTDYLQIVFETSYFVAENHEGGQIENLGFNLGAFLGF